MDDMNIKLSAILNLCHNQQIHIAKIEARLDNFVSITEFATRGDGPPRSRPFSSQITTKDVSNLKQSFEKSDASMTTPNTKCASEQSSAYSEPMEWSGIKGAEINHSGFDDKDNWIDILVAEAAIEKDSIKQATTHSRDSLLPPKEPINFYGGFSIAELNNEKLMLEEENPHYLDSRITFHSESHKYFYDGVPMDQSVTEVIGHFFSKFDADMTAKRMITGNNWPRKPYIQKDGTPYTEEEIKKEWNDIGEYARNTGTWMHYNIERHLNKLGVSPKSEEMPRFLKFYTEVIQAKRIEPYRTEWRIAAPDCGIAGSVDFVGRFPDGTYAVVDWKRAKDFGCSFKSFGNGYGKFPLAHFIDCKGSKYQLQVNMYRHILENYYDVRVSYMAVVSFHPDNGEKYCMYEVPRLEEKVNDVFELIREKKDRL